jgi:hypothetical protein
MYSMYSNAICPQVEAPSALGWTGAPFWWWLVVSCQSLLFSCQSLLFMCFCANLCNLMECATALQMRGPSAPRPYHYVTIYHPRSDAAHQATPACPAAARSGRTHTGAPRESPASPRESRGWWLAPQSRHPYSPPARTGACLHPTHTHTRTHG